MMKPSRDVMAKALNNDSAGFGLVWNADLTLQDDVAGAARSRREAITRAHANRPRTAQLEREIIQAVVVLYLLILGSIAGLHLYAVFTLPTQPPPAESVEQADPAAR